MSKKAHVSGKPRTWESAVVTKDHLVVAIVGVGPDAAKAIDITLACFIKGYKR